jgi:hypothetical protein
VDRRLHSKPRLCNQARNQKNSKRTSPRLCGRKTSGRGTRRTAKTVTRSRPGLPLPTDHASARVLSPRSSVQAGAESVAAPLVYADARNVEVLTDLQPVNAGRDLAILARLLDAWTDVGVPQSDAVFVAAAGSDNLTVRCGAVSVDPVAPPPTVCFGRVGDLLAIAVLPCW